MQQPETYPALIDQRYPTLQLYPGAEQFSWRAEWRHLFSRKLLKACWWPFFSVGQRRLLFKKPFRAGRSLPGFSDLWKTIQKGAFAYNHLFLELPPLQHARRLQVADITTMALFFGDEFIDGIATITGKKFVQQLIQRDPGQFYMTVEHHPSGVRILYAFELEHLLPEGVLQQRNEKYGVSYSELYRLLKEFLGLLNQELKRMPLPLAEKAAYRIVVACNTCFNSFIHDNCPFSASGLLASPEEVLLFHEQKTAYMQAKLLELRCVLAEKEEAMNCIHTPGWLDIMRVIQVYDDIHDAVLDHGVQDNLLLSTARHYFPAEWEWFCRNESLHTQRGECRVLLSLYMPCSMHYCLQVAGRKIQKMNWEQQKIMHYLVLRHNHSLHFDSAAESINTRDSFLARFYERVRPLMPHLSPEEIKSFAIDTAIHVPAIRRRLLKKIKWSAAYQLRFNLLSVNPATKAALFDKLAV